MVKIHAHGILKHHFWGTYSATIGLSFSDKASAADALRTFGGREKGWIVSTVNPSMLVWDGVDDGALDAVCDVLESYGAEREKIASIARSIDHGEPFEVDVPIVPAEQMSLFEVKEVA